MNERSLLLWSPIVYDVARSIYQKIIMCVLSNVTYTWNALTFPMLSHAWHFLSSLWHLLYEIWHAFPIFHFDSTVYKYNYFCYWSDSTATPTLLTRSPHETNKLILNTSTTFMSHIQNNTTIEIQVGKKCSMFYCTSYENWTDDESCLHQMYLKNFCGPSLETMS